MHTLHIWFALVPFSQSSAIFTLLYLKPIQIKKGESITFPPFNNITVKPYYAVVEAVLPVFFLSAACAAASLASGNLKGEQLT